MHKKIDLSIFIVYNLFHLFIDANFIFKPLKGLLMSDRIISIVIPCRNEEKYICGCIESILASDYPKNLLEILLVDGMSEDGTKELIQSYARRFPFIRLYENIQKITPVALNIGIKNSKGEIVIRMDAHSTYPPHYISTCVDYLEKQEVDVVGGPIITCSKENTLIAKTVTMVTSHPFGVGNSKFRTSSVEGFTDTVPFGAYWKSIFDKVGLFNESLIRNQDNELSSRILSAGGKIYFTPLLTANYYNQTTLLGLLRQAVKTGMWNVTTVLINREAFRFRHFIPFVFVSTLLLLSILSKKLKFAKRMLFAVVTSYFSLSMISSIQLAAKNGFRYIFVLPFTFFLYHLSYGLGTWISILKICFKLLKPMENNVESKKNGDSL
ncbi:MAG: glycosyltransferase family 2 protein [Candidatus Riflebacteria bacterium]|nr:glycosyltransferase family 2 protein [Candidatus Riflebacteria bacterium]